MHNGNRVLEEVAAARHDGHSFAGSSDLSLCSLLARASLTRESASYQVSEKRVNSSNGRSHYLCQPVARPAIGVRLGGMAPVTTDDVFAGWAPARLIPTAGIKGLEEQEKRATSALLAVLGAVPEFTHSLLKDLGAPKGRIRTFTEIQLKDVDGKVSIPDGAIVIERGQTRWGVLVEVKTSDAKLADDQVGAISITLAHRASPGF